MLNIARLPGTALSILVVVALLSGVDKKAITPSGIFATDTVAISVDRRMRDSSCFKSVLDEMVADSNGLFRQPTFSTFFASSETRLVFSEREFSWDTGASGKNSGFDTDWNFRDTIFLNSLIFSKACREYLYSIVIHEVMHAYITWACLSFKWERNGVDEEYLKKHFPVHWEWLAANNLPNNAREHILMTENFIDPMVQSLYLYTNPDSDPKLRESIAESLTWGGLNETPAWKGLTLDTCRIFSIDDWARHMDAEANAGNARVLTDVRGCRGTDLAFMHSLQLRPLCR